MKPHVLRPIKVFLGREWNLFVFLPATSPNLLPTAFPTVFWFFIYLRSLFHHAYHLPDTPPRPHSRFI